MSKIAPVFLLSMLVLVAGTSAFLSGNVLPGPAFAQEEQSLTVRAATFENQSEVRVELEFLTDSTDPDTIIDEIIEQFALTREQADELLEIEEQEEELEERFEVRISIEEEFSEAEAELRFIVNSTERDDILDAIENRTQLTIDQILDVLELEVPEETEDEIEIEVKIEGNVAEVKVEINDEETEFVVEFEDRGDIIQKIIEETGLTEDQILAVIEFEIEDDEQEDEDTRPQRVTICHIPPGNPSKAHTITVSSAALEAHLAHGDVRGPCENDFDSKLEQRQAKIAEKLEERDIRLAERQAEREARLAEKQAEREARMAEREDMMDERLAEREARLAEKEQDALQRAEQLIQRLEQRIAQLEQRLQTLLERVETGEYFGPVVGDGRTTNTYSISFGGTASSIFDESVTADVSGQIFLETLGSLEDTSKMRITGGEIFVGENVYDLVFGKTRVSPANDAMIVLGQVVDFESNTNTIRLSLDFDGSIDSSEPIGLEIVPRSGISGQWQIGGTGQLEQTEA